MKISENGKVDECIYCVVKEDGHIFPAGARGNRFYDTRKWAEWKIKNDPCLKGMRVAKLKLEEVIENEAEDKE